MWYCFNFGSTVHGDDDIVPDEEHQDEGMLQPCTQIEKTGCSLMEYNFGNLEFGLFNGHHKHATCMPNASTVSSGTSTSTGSHCTNQKKDRVAARKRKAVAGCYNLRSQKLFGLQMGLLTFLQQLCTSLLVVDRNHFIQKEVVPVLNVQVSISIE
ncbi:hypothetical protein C8J57DRAFT_1236227 [Mycena rebaudengoi]|nr:hypothetical protein C8J57DRAFT_1236227 [Mycena rebaudengoi]